MNSDGSIATIRAHGAKKVRETSLVASAQKRDVPAFEEPIRSVQKAIFRLGLRITGKPEDAADEVLQESLFKASKNFYKFQESSRFSTWMVRIAVNEALLKLCKRHPGRFILHERLQDCSLTLKLIGRKTGSQRDAPG